MFDLTGQQLGNYRLMKLLGEGGFAKVYLGEHVYLKTQAAIKVLHTRMTNTDLEGFLAEARNIARLEHPHIVRVLEFGVESQMPFLVMSYAPNGTLRHIHPKGSRLKPHTVVSYVKQVADALQYAHDERLVHRDVKPENMLLGRRNEVLLSDFGIATIAHNTRSISTQVMSGTVPYMAPEQIAGKARPASDQYSLGIVVYEWLSGERPFQGAYTEIAIQHAVVPPPSLREKIPTISSAVEQVVLTALAKDPHQRFKSVQAFAEALEQASLSVSTLPSTSVPPLTTTQFAPPISSTSAFVRPGTVPVRGSVMSPLSKRRASVSTPSRSSGTSSLANILWAVVVILVILWLLGWLVGNIGPFIHILLVIAVIVLLYNLFVGMRMRRGV